MVCAHNHILKCILVPARSKAFATSYEIPKHQSPKLSKMLMRARQVALAFSSLAWRNPRCKLKGPIGTKAFLHFSNQKGGFAGLLSFEPFKNWGKSSESCVVLAYVAWCFLPLNIHDFWRVIKVYRCSILGQRINTSDSRGLFKTWAYYPTCLCSKNSKATLSIGSWATEVTEPNHRVS